MSAIADHGSVCIRAPAMRAAHIAAMLIAAALALLLALHAHPAMAKAAKKADAPAFQLFIAELWPLAQARGVSRATFDTAFEGVSFDPKIVAHTNNQAEFVKTPAESRCRWTRVRKFSVSAAVGDSP